MGIHTCIVNHSACHNQALLHYSNMNTTAIGKDAEDTAAQWLRSQHFQVLAQNWRTRWCEIDIVAQKSSVLYFIEVRYRKSNAWGDGIESITPKKQQQMEFAASLWLHQYKWKGDARICAIAASGDPVTIGELVEL